MAEINDGILREGGSSWIDVSRAAIGAGGVGEGARLKIAGIVGDLAGTRSAVAGFHDPRTTITLDALRPHLPENLVLVGVFRHPLAVARSLKERDGVDHARALEAWKAYNWRMLAHMERHGGFLLDSDWGREKLSGRLREVLREIGLNHGADLSGCHAPEPTPGSEAAGHGLPAGISALYARLQRAAREPPPPRQPPEAAAGAAARGHPVLELDLNDPTTEQDFLVLLAGERKAVLEFGSAPPRVTRHLRRRGCTVRSIESDSDLAAAACRAAGEGAGAGKKGGENAFAPHHTAGFDTILVGDLIERAADPGPVLRQLAALLNPGGRLVVSVPNREYGLLRHALLYGDRGRAAAGAAGGMPPPRNALSRGSAIQLVGAAGLRIDAMHPITASRWRLPGGRGDRGGGGRAPADPGRTTFLYVFSAVTNPDPGDTSWADKLRE